MPVFRIFVEKKPGYDIEAAALKHEFSRIFGIDALENLRIINRYDVEGLDSSFIDEAVRVVFSEPQQDNTYNELPGGYDHVVGVEALPGQFDQRSDSCAQCLSMLTCGERPLVKNARFYLIKGNLTGEDLQTIKHHLINPVESMEAGMELPETLAEQHPKPAPTPVLSSFLLLDETDMPAFRERYSLAMDTDDLAFCREYFKNEGRSPTLAELRVIDTYWSDHCRHTTFLTHITDVQIEDEHIRQTFEDFLHQRGQLGRGDKPVTLMELATIGARVLARRGQLLTLDKSDEVNACSVKIKVDENGKKQDWLLMFKNETHNHPTEIEPFGGAATCIGGAIRDPLSGRSYVYQAMRVTGSSDPTVPVSMTIPGKLPQRSITTRALRGYSSYGNQIGLATGLVREIYHPGYIAKRLETGAVIGAVPVRNVVRQTPAPGDKVILLGGRTGRDGCGGATGSSKPHSKETLTDCGAEVQKGNAPEERKLQRLFRNPKAAKMIKRCNDFGAGGVAVAVGELADGLSIDLSVVPKKYSGLDGTELAISESQERMAVVVDAGDVEGFMALASEENLEATVIAEISDVPRLTMEYDGQKIVDISREFLDTNGVAKQAKIAIDKAAAGDKSALPSLGEFLAVLLSNLNVCSQKGMVEHFDSTIGAGTVLFPFGGTYQATPAQVMAAKIPVQGKETTTCSLMTYACYPDAASKRPYTGAYLAVATSVAKLIAAGGSRTRCWLSFQEYFERPEDDPKKWGKPFSALLGALQAQLDLGVAAIGGKDSMSGSFENLHVPPTFISFAVSTTDTDNVVSGEFKSNNSDVVLISPEYRDDGIPSASSLRAVFNEVERLISEKKVKAAYVVEEGGIGEAIYKMSIGNRIGFAFDEAFKDTEVLTKRHTGSIVLELEKGVIAGSDPQSLETQSGVIAGSDPQSLTTTAQDVNGTKLGRTTRDFTITLGNSTVDCLDLLEIYEKPLESVFPSKVDSSQKHIPTFSFDNKEQKVRTNEKKSAATSKAKPRVLIPVFPGTNCEYDMARAFEMAGALTKILVIKNLTASDIEQSVSALTEAVNKSQIVALPGGFSGGDEPDGSGKFIVSLFRNPRIKDAIDKLLRQRDGLMCGICNGFQALIKLGLVPFGEIIDMIDTSPTLTFNAIGRHQSALVRTRIASNMSPWLSMTNVGDIHTVAISHGEGRFVADRALIDELASNGQIATQYVDIKGEPSMDICYNPNGSACAIEGITSPDGRVFGKMGHSERMGDNLYKNIPGIKNQDIFTSAVNYFTAG